MQLPLLRRILLPYVIGLQSVPKVALVPLFVVWFGIGLSSKIVLGILLTFFPLMINPAAGLSGATMGILLQRVVAFARAPAFCSGRRPMTRCASTTTRGRVSVARC